MATVSAIRIYHDIGCKSPSNLCPIDVPPNSGKGVNLQKRRIEWLIPTDKGQVPGLSVLQRSSECIRDKDIP